MPIKTHCFENDFLRSYSGENWGQSIVGLEEVEKTLGDFTDRSINLEHEVGHGRRGIRYVEPISTILE